MLRWSFSISFRFASSSNSGSIVVTVRFTLVTCNERRRWRIRTTIRSLLGQLPILSSGENFSSAPGGTQERRDGAKSEISARLDVALVEVAREQLVALAVDAAREARDFPPQVLLALEEAARVLHGEEVVVRAHVRLGHLQDLRVREQTRGNSRAESGGRGGAGSEGAAFVRAWEADAWHKHGTGGIATRQTVQRR